MKSQKMFLTLYLRPSNCGNDCPGKSRDIKYCNPTPCPGVADYRQQQCSLLNTFKPGIDLVPDYNGMLNLSCHLLEFGLYTCFVVPTKDQCRLKCVSVSKVKYTVTSAEAAEGTHCNNKTNNRCFYGKCHVSFFY